MKPKNPPSKAASVKTPLVKAPEEIKHNGKSWKLIGKVKGPHGLKGDFLIHLFSTHAKDWLSDLKKVLFVDTKSTLLTVNKIKTNGSTLILTSSEIQDRTAAEKILKPVVYAPAELFIASEGDSVFLSEIKGFEVIESGTVKIGKITGFDSNGPQDLLIVRRPNGQDAMIPFVEAFLQKIDFEKKSVFMILPPGLLDLMIEDPEETQHQKPESSIEDSLDDEDDFEDDDFDEDES